MLGFGIALAGSATAQGLETLGSRAAGMAAFVAVADDASAVAWNPSGLVTGPIFNVQIDLGRSTNKPNSLPAERSLAADLDSTLIAIGTTPVGLAYYRLRTASFEGGHPAVVEIPDRQLRRVSVRTLITSHLGATVQQSVGDYVTLGATLKLVRGSVGAASVDVESWDDAFERAESVERQGATRGDLDVGAMVAVGRMRAGLVARNLTAPSFGEEGRPGRATLKRHVRVGMAWADRWPGLSHTVISVDADVTRVPHPSGERRDVAAGAEQWLGGQRIGVRGGVRASTTGDARVVLSAGGSYAVRAGMYVDAFVARGAADDRGWGIAARLTY
jgi:hypothetical protein